MSDGTELAQGAEDSLPKISMEHLEVCRLYLETWSTEKTAEGLGMSVPEVEAVLAKREVSRYIDRIFREQGYLNRFKIAESFTELIKMKMDEVTEAGIGSNKDIADLLMMMHKMSMDHAKIESESNKTGPSNQKNVQINNYGDNYHNLTNALKKKKD